MMPDPCSAGRPGTPLPLEAARLRALAAARPLCETEALPLHLALGRALAAPATARLDLPPFDNAAMDGYALHAADLAAGGMVAVEGRTVAGDAVGPPLRPGVARRIMTGAPVPEGTAAVVMQERVTRSGDRLRLDCSVAPGANVRREERTRKRTRRRYQRAAC